MKTSKDEQLILSQCDDILEKHLCCGDISSEEYKILHEILCRLEMDNSTIVSKVATESSSDIFSFDTYLSGLIITKYIGFDDENIIIPAYINGKKVLAIGEKAFCNSKNLKSIIIPEGVMAIGLSCFEGCSNLLDVSLPKTLKAISERAFFQTASTQATIPDSVFYLGEYVFAKTPICQLVLSSSIRKIPANAFWCCNKLIHIYIPEGVNELSECAFSDCSNLESVHLPNGLSSIEAEAFCNCSLLKEIDIPKSVTKMGENIFSERYLIQPDRRYNPRTGYDTYNVTIHCFPGSFAQMYARDNGLQSAPCKVNYSASVGKNMIYTTGHLSSKHEKGVIMNYLQQQADYEWVMIDNSEIIVRSHKNNPEQRIEIKRDRQYILSLL